MEGTRENNVSSVEKDFISPQSDEVATDDDIPILTEENYTSWKGKMEKLLNYKGVWDYVMEAKREPDHSNEDWKQKKEDIISIFRKKCGARTLPYIEGLENMSLIWSQIVTMYEFTYPTSNTTGRKRTQHTWCLPLYRAIRDGNWKSVSELVSGDIGVLTARLTSDGDLPLHVAVQQQKTEIAKEFIKMMPAVHLSRQGKDETTALFIAAICGNKEVIKAMVEQDENLLMIKSKFYLNRIPIMIAIIYGHKDAVNYLYPITIRKAEEDHTDQEGEKTRVRILNILIFGAFYGQALDLLQKYPGLILVRDVANWLPMDALSEMPTSFKSSLQSKKSVGSLGYYFMYSFGAVLDVQVDAKNACCYHTERGDEENPLDDDANGNNTQAGNMRRSRTSSIIFEFVKGLWLRFRWLFQNALIKLVPGCKDIYEEKLKHYEASELLKQMWRLISELDDLTSVNKAVGSAMSRATQNGIVEFIEECINYCPELLKTSRTLVFNDAIKYRQEKIFGLIHRLGPMKIGLATMKYGSSGDYMSHTAAKKAPIERLNQVPGAALQMQRELLWYKEVESIMMSSHETYTNHANQRPRKLFTEEHQDLLKEGAVWLKGTSTQCMVVATLITTIMFAALFTVPGHGGGEPNNYIQGKFSIVFITSNILALCSSVASMLMFLAIITSRYAEEDFLSTLHRMLMLGLLFLFVSIVGMMIAFVAAVLFMLHYEVRVWASFPIIFLASVPITIYALVEFPLFIQLMFTTSSSAVFGKRKLN